jgi:hypothetical protein
MTDFISEQYSRRNRAGRRRGLVAGQPREPSRLAEEATPLSEGDIIFGTLLIAGGNVKNDRRTYKSYLGPRRTAMSSNVPPSAPLLPVARRQRFQTEEDE